MRVAVVPVPVIAPGLIVHDPAGSPFKTTLPVDTEQVGWVMEPMVGADGAPGVVLITTSADRAELHPEASVTV